MNPKTFYSRQQQKHDVEENWLKAVNFIPMQGEIIIYDVDEMHSYERMKIGDGYLNVNALPFFASDISSTQVLHNLLPLDGIIDEYLLNIDYDTSLGFDVSEIIFSGTTTSVLGQAILGQLVLA